MQVAQLLVVVAAGGLLDMAFTCAGRRVRFLMRGRDAGNAGTRAAGLVCLQRAHSRFFPQAGGLRFLGKDGKIKKRRIRRSCEGIRGKY